MPVKLKVVGDGPYTVELITEEGAPPMAMKLTFSSTTAAFAGGERYVPGKTYFLGKEEACLWIKRGVVDLGSVEPAHLTEEAQAENQRNLQPGKALTLAEIVSALAEGAVAGA